MMSKQSIFSLNKIVSVFLIGSQIATVSTSLASPNMAVTPETTLISQVITLQGSGLTQSQLQDQVTQVAKNYLVSAPAEGRTERLEQAMVDADIYTPAQAKSFADDTAAATSQIGENSSSAQVSRMIGELISSHPAGAQFSACDASYALAVPGYLGAFVLFSMALVAGNGNCMPSGVYDPKNPGEVALGECGTPQGDASTAKGDATAAKFAGIGGALLVVGIIGSIMYSHSCD